MRDKKKITEEVLKKLPNLSEMPVDELYHLWWYNIRGGGGLRLTTLGYDIFAEHLKIPHYSYKLDPTEFDSKLLIMLDKKLQMPYYIKTQKKLVQEIVFFSSEEAILANLYGSVKAFIEKY